MVKEWVQQTADWDGGVPGTKRKFRKLCCGVHRCPQPPRKKILAKKCSIYPSFLIYSHSLHF